MQHTTSGFGRLSFRSAHLLLWFVLPDLLFSFGVAAQAVQTAANTSAQAVQSASGNGSRAVESVAATSAQAVQSAAIATEQGIWIYLGNEIPKDFTYEILRKAGNGNFNSIGTTGYPEEERDLRSRIDAMEVYFPNLPRLGDADIAHVRAYAATNATTDTILLNNLPVMHLAFGTAFLDTDVKEGETYQYQVRKMTGSNNQAWERNSNTVRLPASPDILRPVYRDKEESATEILLRWYVPRQGSLNTFAVYRRVFGQGDFRKADAVTGYNASGDSIFLLAVDTLVQSPAVYEYYIKPLDIYGNAGPSSDTVSAATMGGEYNPLPEYMRAEGLDNNHQVILHWKFGDQKYMRSLELYRSNAYDSGYIRIAALPPSDTTYTDIVPLANENYWYYLIVNGPVSRSLPTARIPVMFSGRAAVPGPPEEVAAETVPGGVKIYWSYDEPYVKGFYVYRYVYETTEYVQVSDLVPADSVIMAYTDTSSVLRGDDVYRYAVRTVNDVDQLSDLSPSASAVPGLSARLESPVNLRVSVADKGVMLVWDDLRNAVPALLGYKVYRKTGTDGEFVWMQNDTMRGDWNYYRDTTLVPRNTYRYTVSAIDFYGNESPLAMQVSYGLPGETLQPPVIERAVSTDEGILVVWGQVTGDNIATVNLYRYVPGGKPALIASLTGEAEQYLDPSAAAGTLYIYEISVATAGGNESERSRGVSVRR